MNKIILLIISVVIMLLSCQEESVNMKEYINHSQTITLQVPSNMYFSKETDNSLLFESKQNFISVMWTESANGKKWDLERFSQHIIGDKYSQLSLSKRNDTLIVYEIRKGMTAIPAQIFSIHERSGYSIVLLSMGLGLDIHQLICNSIRCNSINANIIDNIDQICKKLVYDGDYIKLMYPAEWNVNNQLNSLTADVYIGQQSQAFGFWLFRFEIDEGVDFKDGMLEVANNWRETANVDINYKIINNQEWCEHNITANINGTHMRQISYYCLKDNYIYNVRFGNNPIDVDNNYEIISDIMSSISLK